MDLPFPGMSFSPFDILTAEEMNMMAANDQSLQAQINTNAARKPKILNITLNSTTGTQTVTGVGYRASSALTQSQGTGGVIFFASGSAVDNSGTIDQSCTAIRSEGSAGNQTLTEGQSFLHVTGGGSGQVRAQITGFTADGFTINIITMATTAVGPRQWRVTLFP